MENTNIVNDIERIVKDNLVQIIEANGRTFSTKELEEILPTKHTASQLRFSDLASIVEIVKQEIDKFICPLYINIESETVVTVVSSLDTEKCREKPFCAVADGSKFRFGSQYDYESFVIAVRSLFVQTDDTASLLEVLKKVSNVDSVEVEDDGVTQKVVASQGAMLASNLKVAPIRKLAPFRTFIEVEQPESEFLFRLSDKNCFALHEADGGAWRINAKKNIRAFFESALSEYIADGKVIVLG